MKTLYFEQYVHASPAMVYTTMLQEDSFRLWTAVFSATSRYQGDWKKGSKIIFLSEEADGKTCGMISRIKDNRKHDFVSIEHLGLFEEGQELLTGPRVDAFKGALEEYTFEPRDGGTLLKVRMDSIDEWESYFLETWPKALVRVKELCERPPQTPMNG